MQEKLISEQTCPSDSLGPPQGVNTVEDTVTVSDFFIPSQCLSDTSYITTLTRPL